MQSPWSKISGTAENWPNVRFRTRSSLVRPSLPYEWISISQESNRNVKTALILEASSFKGAMSV